jgi:E3 ubiquitin-protein ligase HECTD1
MQSYLECFLNCIDSKVVGFFSLDFLDSCRASTLLAELDDDEDLPEPDEEDDENEDDNQEDQEYEEVMVEKVPHSLH